MSHKKFIKDIGIFGITQIAGTISGFITLPIITKLLGVKSYGIWSQMSVTITLISIVALLGLPYTLIRFLAGENDKRKIQDGVWSVATIVFCCSLIIALLLIIFADPIAKFFNCEKILIYLLAFIALFDYLSQVFYNAIRAFQKIGVFSSFFTFQELGETALIIIFIYSGFGLTGTIAAVLITRFIICLGTGIYIISKIGLSTPRFLRIKEYLSFGLPGVPDAISHWIIQSSDRYIIGFFLGTLFVGYYSPAYVIGFFVINLLVSPFGFMLPAILSKYYDENKTDEVKTYLRYSLKYFLLFAIPAVFGLSVLSKQLLSIITTPEIANNAHLIMPLVAISMIPMGINAIVVQIISITKKTKAGAVITIIAALLNLGLNFILIPKFGIMGAALTTFIAYAFICTATWVYASKFFVFNPDWQTISKSIAASIVMSLGVYWLHPLGLYRTLFAIASGALTYGILMFLLKSFNQQEIQLFISAAKKIPTSIRT